MTPTGPYRRSAAGHTDPVPALLTDHHPGRLVAEFESEVTVTVLTTRAEAVRILRLLSRRRTARTIGTDGLLYALNGRAFIVASWEPET